MSDSLLTVTVPASGATAFDLTTIADVKTDLDITGATLDTLLQRYVTETSLDLAAACRTVFARETVSEQFRPTEARDALLLTRRPVVSFTSVTEDGVLLAGTKYEADVNAGRIYRLENDVRTSWPAAKTVVIYQAGYDLPTAAPKDLQKAARALVVAQYRSKGRDPLVRSESVDSVGEQSFWLPDEASRADVQAVLDRYSNPIV